MSDSPKPPGPLAIKIFRALWLAGLVSNVGSFMHGVGASWLLTSLSTPEDIIQGLASGADNFVVKPYQEDFLIARIRTVLGNCRLKQMSDDDAGIAVEFAGQRYVIDSSRRQILNLLLSTYETAVKTNFELIETMAIAAYRTDATRPIVLNVSDFNIAARADGDRMPP